MSRRTPEEIGAAVAEEIRIARRLLAEDGCAWDREQTLASMTPYLIEEAHEVVETIAHDDGPHLREELGDVLYLVAFFAELAERAYGFDLADVAADNVTKLTRRHPHVFGDRDAADATMALRAWEELKAAERGGVAGAKPEHPLGKFPKGLPALIAAYRTQQKAAAAGFDWATAGDAFAKVREEVGEVAEALDAGDHAALGDEIGDALFALATFARHAGHDPEQVLHSAVRRYRERYARMVGQLEARGATVGGESLEALLAEWKVAKGR